MPHFSIRNTQQIILSRNDYYSYSLCSLCKPSSRSALCLYSIASSKEMKGNEEKYQQLNTNQGWFGSWLTPLPQGQQAPQDNL